MVNLLRGWLYTCFILSALLMLFQSHVTHKGETPMQFTRACNLRSGPGMKHDIISNSRQYLRNPTFFEVERQDNWSHARKNGTTFWVHTSCVTTWGS